MVFGILRGPDISGPPHSLGQGKALAARRRAGGSQYSGGGRVQPVGPRMTADVHRESGNKVRLVRLRFVRFAFRAFCVLCALRFGCLLKNVTRIRFCVSVAF